MQRTKCWYVCMIVAESARSDRRNLPDTVTGFLTADSSGVPPSGKAIWTIGLSLDASSDVSSGESLP
eukprot:629204-Prymnesium_polylepis.1